MATYKYFGHYITEDFSNDADINRQHVRLFMQGNNILRKLYMCSLDVTPTLFRIYCSPMYFVHLLRKYKKSTVN